MPPLTFPNWVVVNSSSTAVAAQSISVDDAPVEGGPMWHAIAKKSVDVEVKKIDFQILIQYMKSSPGIAIPLEDFWIYSKSGRPLAFLVDDIDPPLSKWVCLDDNGVPQFSITDYDLQRLDVVRLQQLFITRRKYEVKEVVHVIDRNEQKGYSFLRPMRSDEYINYHTRAIENIRKKFRTTGKL